MTIQITFGRRGLQHTYEMVVNLDKNEIDKQFIVIKNVRNKCEKILDDNLKKKQESLKNSYINKLKRKGERKQTKKAVKKKTTVKDRVAKIREQIREKGCTI